MNKDYELYVQKSQEIADINYAICVLQWDQETYMPGKGFRFRGQQIGTLSALSHNLSVANEYGDLMHKLAEDKNLDPVAQTNIRESLTDYKRSMKFSADFVKKFSLTINDTFQSWQKARDENDFSVYAPQLDKLLDLVKERAELIGYQDHPYDALMDEYEPGFTTKDADVLFSNVKDELVPFIKSLGDKKQKSDNFFYGKFDKDKQWVLGIDLLKQMGYDFEGGRQDISHHPFTTNFSPEDVRVTTRIDEGNLSEMIWSCIHEGGHALYEQGLPVEQYGMPAGSYLSLGVHESQSRFWENNIGRSLGYWENNFSMVQERFPEQFKNTSSLNFYHGMNKVQSSLIRTNADELTYHLHVLIRFEIEKEIIERKIKTADLRDAWNEKYQSYLGIDVPDDNQGVLQDVHWAHGSLGYFPTYSIGSFLAAQLYGACEKSNPSIDEQIRKGEFSEILNWLKTNIHQYGKQFSAEEICIKATGEKLNFKYFMDYAQKKYLNIYS